MDRKSSIRTPREVRTRRPAEVVARPHHIAGLERSFRGISFRAPARVAKCSERLNFFNQPSLRALLESDGFEMLEIGTAVVGPNGTLSTIVYGLARIAQVLPWNPLPCPRAPDQAGFTAKASHAIPAAIEMTELCAC